MYISLIYICYENSDFNNTNQAGKCNMKQIDFYDIIFKRKSIRKFDLTPIDKNTFDVISRNIEKLVPLFPEIKTEIKIVSPRDVKGLIQVKAPYYIAAFSQPKEGYLTNMGFILQQLDLFFSANGLGCCWQGWPKPTSELRSDLSMEFIIVLAFGYPKEKLHRGSVNEFNRKPLIKIKTTPGFDELLEPARLAPSPTQPWFFICDKQMIHIYYSKARGIMAKFTNKLNRIEVGIALSHLWISALHFNKKIGFIINNNQIVPKGYTYVITANIQ